MRTYHIIIHVINSLPRATIIQKLLQFERKSQSPQVLFYYKFNLSPEADQEFTKYKRYRAPPASVLGFENSLLLTVSLLSNSTPWNVIREDRYLLPNAVPNPQPSPTPTPQPPPAPRPNKFNGIPVQQIRYINYEQSMKKMISSSYYFKRRDTLYKEGNKKHRIFTELSRNHKVTRIK